MKLSMTIARVFPRRTNATPDDPLAFVGMPDLLTPEWFDEVHISVAFTYDVPFAYQLAEIWGKRTYNLRMGGPGLYGKADKKIAGIDTIGGEFTPGMYLKKGYVITSRGCPNSCLSGDTLVNTIDGNIPIIELVGKETKVLTRDIGGKPIFANAINIRKIGQNDKLIRIHFDDKSHLDCTPDHLLRKFKNGNQFMKPREYELRADELKKGDSVIAIHVYGRADGYLDVVYGRHKSINLHRLVMSGKLNRELLSKEHVHHLDSDRKNNHPDNLTLTDSHSHIKYHPEIANRMKIDNPTKQMTDGWREKIKIAGTGSRRTIEQRLKYRKSKLGIKNPNYRHGKSYKPSRILPYVNHKVTRIEYLSDRQDTYCLEVPGFDWFFANNIFVHNCWYCSVPEREGDIREIAIHTGWNVLDNNLLACSEKHITEVFQMLMKVKQVLYKRIEFTGGFEAKRFRHWHCEWLSRLKPKQIFFSYDKFDDFEPLKDAGRILKHWDIPKDSRRCYVLCGYNLDTFDNAEYRMRQAIEAGFIPMAMLYRDERGIYKKDWTQFQKEWVRPAIMRAKGLLNVS